ncbi:MAG: DUF2065 domain-containing protein [Bilophila wadsworthia]
MRFTASTAFPTGTSFRPLLQRGAHGVQQQAFFSALGLAFILEALPYTLFPERMRQVLQTLGEEGASGLRRMGLFSLAAGLIVLWLTLG